MHKYIRSRFLLPLHPRVKIFNIELSAFLFNIETLSTFLFYFIYIRFPLRVRGLAYLMHFLRGETVLRFLQPFVSSLIFKTLAFESAALSIQYAYRI